MAANGVCGPHGTDSTTPAAVAPHAVADDGMTFGSVLQAINPLQYVPVVGSIYRIATGDAAPSGLRAGVSAIMGALTGGPIGLIGSIFASLAEQFFHMEDRVRSAMLAPSAPATSAVGLTPAPTAAYAEAGQSLDAAPAAARAANAYRAAGLLGAV